MARDDARDEDAHEHLRDASSAIIGGCADRADLRGTREVESLARHGNKAALETNPEVVAELSRARPNGPGSVRLVSAIISGTSAVPSATIAARVADTCGRSDTIRISVSVCTVCQPTGALAAIVPTRLECKVATALGILKTCPSCLRRRAG